MHIRKMYTREIKYTIVRCSYAFTSHVIFSKKTTQYLLVVFFFIVLICVITPFLIFYIKILFTKKTRQTSVPKTRKIMRKFAENLLRKNAEIKNEKRENFLRKSGKFFNNLKINEKFFRSLFYCQSKILIILILNISLIV